MTDIPCRTCGGDATERIPRVVEDEIYYNMWTWLLKNHNKYVEMVYPEGKKNTLIKAKCGWCLIIDLNRDRGDKPTFYELVKRKKQGR